MGTLGSLRILELVNQRRPASSYSPLAQLTSLTRLTLKTCDAIPACLSQLTTLEHCRLKDTPTYSVDDAQEEEDGTPVVDGSTGSIGAALAPLTRLTTLIIDHSECEDFFIRLDRPPTGLAGLGQLRQLAFLVNRNPIDTSLPAGPWLSSLQTLVLPAAVAKHNLGLLDTASKLSSLWVTDNPRDAEDEKDTVSCITMILCWGACHPSLQRIVLNFSPDWRVPAVVYDASLDALGRKPTLRIERKYTHVSRMHDTLLCKW